MKTITAIVITSIIATGLLLTTSTTFPIGHINAVFAQQTTTPSGSSSSSSSSNSTATTAASAECNNIASQFGAKAMSNGNVCSIFIVRKSPTVMSHDGMPLNNFVVASNLLEIAPMTTAATATSLTNNNSNVMVMGEFALLEPELVPVKKVLDERVNVTAVHNHMVMESPKLINVHWEAHGQLTSIIPLVKEALGQTSIMGGGPAISTTAGSTNSNSSANNNPLASIGNSLQNLLGGNKK